MTYRYFKISDLKNRARKLAREEGLLRHLALDKAAQLGGFQNFAHAFHQLPACAVELTQHVIEIVQHWRERETKTWGNSRISVPLTVPLQQLVKQNQWVDVLAGCRPDGENRAISDGFMRDRRDSENDLGRIARVLQFIDATGLKPSRARRCYPKGYWKNRPPIADHDSCWFDPIARVHVLITQPYPGHAEYHEAEQKSWEACHDWATLQTTWGSIYGHGTAFYLLCPVAYAPVLRLKIVRLEAGPAAIVNKLVDTGNPLRMRP